MKISKPVGAYRESAVEGASAVELVLMLYDAAISSLRRAIRALETQNIERCTAHLNHVLDVVGELQASLNFPQGGEVARRLTQFYNFVRLKVLEANGKGSEEILGSLIEQFVALRDALAQADRAANSVDKAAPDGSPSEPAASETAAVSLAPSGWRV